MCTAGIQSVALYVAYAHLYKLQYIIAQFPKLTYKERIPIRLGGKKNMCKMSNCCKWKERIYVYTVKKILTGTRQTHIISDTTEMSSVPWSLYKWTLWNMRRSVNRAHNFTGISLCKLDQNGVCLSWSRNCPLRIVLAIMSPVILGSMNCDCRLCLAVSLECRETAGNKDTTIISLYLWDLNIKHKGRQIIIPVTLP